MRYDLLAGVVFIGLLAYAAFAYVMPDFSGPPTPEQQKRWDDQKAIAAAKKSLPSLPRSVRLSRCGRTDDSWVIVTKDHSAVSLQTMAGSSLDRVRAQYLDDSNRWVDYLEMNRPSKPSAGHHALKLRFCADPNRDHVDVTLELRWTIQGVDSLAAKRKQLTFLETLPRELEMTRCGEGWTEVTVPPHAQLMQYSAGGLFLVDVGRLGNAPGWARYQFEGTVPMKEPLKDVRLKFCAVKRQNTRSIRYSDALDHPLKLTWAPRER